MHLKEKMHREIKLSYSNVLERENARGIELKGIYASIILS